MYKSLVFGDAFLAQGLHLDTFKNGSLNKYGFQWLILTYNIFIINYTMRQLINLINCISNLAGNYIYIYAFSRHFNPKRLTVHSGYTFFVLVYLPILKLPQNII